jgi:hypothetical protein
MTLDRTQPPPGFADYCGGYHIAEHSAREHYSEGFDEFTLEEAWEFYDRITLPARVALLRELAEELAGGPDVWSTSDHGAFEEKAYDDITAMLRGRADALEAGK